MKKMMFPVLVILLSVIVILVGIFAVKRFVYRGYYLDIVISRDILIDKDWQSIDAQGKIIVQKDRQFVSFVLDDQFALDDLNRGIKLPNGEIINPEIILKDNAGREIRFQYSGGRRLANRMIANFEPKESLAANSKYSAILVRSPTPIKVKEVLWSGYNIADQP